MKILHLLSGGGIGGIEMLCLNIAQLSRDQNEFCFLYAGGMIADEMKERGIPVYLFYEKKLLFRMRRLLKLVKEKKYDVIIVHHEGIGIYSYYLMLMHCCSNVKFIKYLHCSFEKKYFYTGNKIKDWLNYNVLKRALLQSNCAIAVSKFVKRSYCKEFDCDADMVKVVYNGIEVSNFDENRYRKDMQSDSIGLLYIGRLIEVKGVHLLLYAVQSLIKVGENIHLEILGDGPQRSEYEQLTQELGIEDRVCFEGNKFEKQQFYDNAQIFVYPSVWQEAFGISIVEALAQGLICVASNSGGIPEIISDGEDGFLFENDNIDDLTKALLKAIAQCKCGKKAMIMAAQRKVKQFDIKKTINELQKICKQLEKE